MSLKGEIENYRLIVKNMSGEISYLKEQLAWFRKQMFGSKSDRISTRPSLFSTVSKFPDPRRFRNRRPSRSPDISGRKESERAKATPSSNIRKTFPSNA